MRLDRLGRVDRIVSGGQSGADRAALDWAIDRGLAHGGWCPRGRLAEDGPIPPRYNLREMPTSRYIDRTRRNVLDSDGTLILNLGALDGGTLETLTLAEALGRPCLVLQLEAGSDSLLVRRTLDWLETHRIAQLNIAGPRESRRPGTYRLVYAFLEALAPAGDQAGRA